MSKNEMPVPQSTKAAATLKDDEAVFDSSEGIEVVALRDGFFNNFRIKEGDTFYIPSMVQLGSWMRMTNSKLEAARKAKKSGR